MDAVCEDKEDEEHNLESGEGGIGCNYDGGGWAGCKDGGDEVREEGRHYESGKTHSEMESRALGCSGTASWTPIRSEFKFSARCFTVFSSGR